MNLAHSQALVDEITRLEALLAEGRKVLVFYGESDRLRGAVVEAAKKWVQYHPKESGECSNSDANWLRMSVAALKSHDAQTKEEEV